MAGFLGSGDLYYERVVAGVKQGWLLFGNATKFEIKENSELKERTSKQKATYGQVLDSVAIKQPAEISIALDDINKDNLALAFLGTAAPVSISGSTVTDEVHTANLDAMLQTVNRNISSVIVNHVSGTPVYVLDTDYTIENAEMGLIKILSTGAITDLQQIHVDYTYGTVTGNKISGGVESSIKVALLLDGENFADQSKAMVNVWEAVVSPTSGVDFLADDFTTIELSGTLNTPTGKSNGYEVETDLVYT